MTADFQTKTQIRKLLAQAGVRPRRRMGQNFLIDRNLADVLIREAEITADSLVLEVGAGCGMLTRRLACHARAVVSVEMDPRLCAVASRELARTPNVTLIEGNALEKNSLNPAIGDALRRLIASHESGDLLMVSNLPYQIASPLLVAIAESDLGFARAAFTVQKEVAERITARAGSSHYGLLAVLLQLHGEFKLLRILSPKVFWPRPKVESAFVTGHFSIRPPTDYDAFKTFIKHIFTQRRKKLLNAAKSAKAVSIEKLRRTMEARDISSDIRAQALPPRVLAEIWAESALGPDPESRE